MTDYSSIPTAALPPSTPTPPMPERSVSFGSNSPPLSQRSRTSSRSSYGSTASTETTKFLRWRKFTLFAACFIPFGAQFAKQCISPLRPYFEQHGVTPTEFGLYLSAPSWPNLVQPLVITLFVDHRGHESGAILFSAFALLGHALFAASLSITADYGTWVGVLGRVLFGFGQGGSGIVQGAILGCHFDSDLSFAIGLAQSVKNLSNWLGRLTPVAMAQYFDDNYLVPIWFCCGVLLVSALLAVVHVTLEEVHKPFSFNLAQQHNHNGESESGVGGSTGGPHYSLDLPHHTGGVNNDELKPLVVISPQPKPHGLWAFCRTAPMAFWAINVLHFLFSNTAGLFTGFATSFYVHEYGLSMQTAAFLASLDALSPILVAPLVGKFVDRYGGRMTLLAAFGMGDVLCFVLFAFHSRDTLPGGAWIPTVLLSVAASAPSTLLKSCIPIVCPHRQDMVIAFSIYFVFENLGHAIGQLVLGELRARDQTSYQLNLLFLCGVSVAAVACSLLVKKVDEWRWNGSLSRASGGGDRGGGANT